MSIIAGRVSTVSNPANQTRFAEVASYAEHGAIQTLKLGGLLTGAEAANEVWTYNNRLQPIETRLRTGGSALNLSRLEYFYCPPNCFRVRVTMATCVRSASATRPWAASRPGPLSSNTATTH